MESVYPPNEFCCSEKVNPREYFKTFSDSVLRIEPMDSPDEALARFAGVHNKSLELLEETCSIGKLYCSDEKEPVPVPATIRSFMRILPWPVVTETVQRCLKTLVTKEQQNKNTTLSFRYQDKVRQEFETIIAINDDTFNFQNIEPYKHMLFTVRIYTPFSHKYATKNYHGNMKCSHEIIALGTNTLAELRDKILCNTDVGVCKEVEVPTKEIESASSQAKELYPSGFIFIENVFYNDFRQPNAIDYSEVIREWATKRHIGNFKMLEMDKVKLHDLSPRLGYPYVYQHQANCEHIVVFSDIRLVQKFDSLNKSVYPYYHSINRYISQICMICGLSVAGWICVDSDRLPHDHTYLCHDCFTSYSYIDGKKVGTFKAYPYFDRSTVL